MSLEDFRKQLEQAWVKNKKDQRDATAAKRQREEQFVSKEQEASRRRQEEERAINVAVVAIEPSLSLKEYLELIGDKIAPGKEVQRWGPENGRIAYSLVCQTWNTPGEPPMLGYWGDQGSMSVQSFKVFGIVLHHSERISIRLKDLSEESAPLWMMQKGIPYKLRTRLKADDFNPLSWGSGDYKTLGSDGQIYQNRWLDEKADTSHGFQTNSKEEMKRFAKVLTEFFVEPGANLGRHSW